MIHLKIFKEDVEEAKVVTSDVAITTVEEEEEEGMIEFLIILKNQIRDNPQDGVEEAIGVKEEEQELMCNVTIVRNMVIMLQSVEMQLSKKKKLFVLKMEIMKSPHC